MNEDIKSDTFDVCVNMMIDQAKREGADRGFDIDEFRYTGFGNQGDGASWTGHVRVPEYIDWKLRNGGVDGLTDVTLEVMFWLFNGGVFDRKLAVFASGYYSHDKTMNIADFYWTFMGNNDTETMGNWGGPFADTPVKELLKATGWTWETELDANDTYNRLWAQILNDVRDYAVEFYKRLEDTHAEIYYSEHA